MKNAGTFPAIILTALLFLQSCSKNTQDGFASQTQPDQLITATLTSGETYTFTGGTSGTLTVTRQAQHYQLSETATDEEGSPIYSYTPKTGYLGSDEVVLMYAASPAAAPTEHTGGCPAHNGDMSGTNSITIKFNVTN